MTEYQTPRLPRLLDRERVEVRLDINGTHVYEESGIDRLITHLAEAKQLFHPELSTLRSELDALSSTCTGEVKAPSYASVVRELHLTRDGAE